MNENLTLGDQTPVFLGLAAIAAEAPYLPRVYATTAQTHDLNLQVDTAGDFEAWRVALNLATSDVEVKEFHTSRWLGVCGVWRGLSVYLTTHGVEIPADEPEGDELAGLPSAWSAQVAS